MIAIETRIIIIMMIEIYELIDDTDYEINGS